MRDVGFLKELTNHTKAISLGCGEAPEKNLFEEHIGVDHNPKYNPDVLENALIYLDGLDDETEQLFLALDVDSNMPLVRLGELAQKKLQPGGQLIITERRDNTRIYGRSMLEPYIEQLTQGWDGKLYKMDGFELFALVLTKQLKE